MERSVAPLSPAGFPSGLTDSGARSESSASGVSWAAVIAGAIAGSALSLILLALGAGLGLSSISPWSNVGASASGAGKEAIAWIVLTQILASAMGGYLAGRLRTKWTTIHTDEVYFRDTAHGFLAWAAGLVFTAAFLVSAAESMVAGPPRFGAANMSTAGSVGRMGGGAAARNVGANEYLVESLFRSDHPSVDRDDAAVRGEAELILANGLRQKGVPAGDKTYLGSLIAAKTGIAQADAERRVSDVFAELQQTADTARRTAADFSLWLFLALISGAFCGSYSATIGGRQRDHVKGA